MARILCRRFRVLQKEYQFLLQINDIVRFCVLPNLAECTPLSVDLNFNLGDFYVTVTSYKNKKLKNKEGNNLVHIGPIQTHYRKLVSSYRFIGSSLK